MAHSERWAKRLLGRLSTAEPEELFENPSFWDATFLRLYLDRLDDRLFRNPQKALRWAEVAPRLALKVPEEAGPAGRQAHRKALVRAYAILGGAYRAVSRTDDAEGPYRLALRITESARISPEIRADLDLRLAHLRACQGRPAEALRLSDSALETYGSEPCLDRSRGLLWRGYALAELGRFLEAIESFGEALHGIKNPKESPAAERAYHAAIHNLADAIAKAILAGKMNHAAASTALEYVRMARELLKGKRLSVAFHKLNWTEGLCWRAHGMDARAEQAFKVARRGFIRLRLPWEIALVSLDLCALHHDCGEWTELESLAADTYERFRALSGNTQALAALSLCVDAARARRGLSAAAGRELIEQASRNAAAAISGAREVVIARMARP